MTGYKFDRYTFETSFFTLRCNLCGCRISKGEFYGKPVLRAPDGSTVFGGAVCESCTREG